MEFWIGLILFSLLLIAIEIFLPNKFNKIVFYIFLFSLWFISAFRYMIGWDYESYIFLFENVNLNSIFPEITLNVISVFLRENGFDFQCLFIIYSTVTFYFVFLGLKKYANKNYFLMILSMYIFFASPLLYWNSFSIIRQCVAVSIFFWSSQFIISREFKKYFIAILFASLWHYSAIILIFAYWLCAFNVKLKYYVLIFIASLGLNLSNLIPIILERILLFIGIYAEYIELGEANFTTGITAIFSIVVYFILLLFRNKKSELEKLLFNMGFISIVFIILLNFSAPIYRMRVYFEIFNILLVPIIVIKIKRKFNTYLPLIILFPYAIMFLSYIYSSAMSVDGIVHPFISSNNIEYQFNFKLLK